MDRESIPHRVRFLRTPAVSSEGVSRWLSRSLNVPCDRGPEGKYDFDNMVEKNRREFSKFNPVAQPPDKNAPLAPLRDDMPLIDPCSGQLSAAAQVHLGSKIRPPFTDRVYPPSDLWVPPGVRERPQTPPMRPSALQYDESDHNRWNSRLKLGGWPSVPTILGSSEINTDACLSALPDSIEKAARHFIYTSTAQRGYEDVDWDAKLPPRHKPPTTTLEKMADRVSQHSVLKKYHSRPELWQGIGSHWTKQQLRATFYPRKPISFCSPCPKSGQIPLYCGTVGSENMDSVDITDEDFVPLTLLRTTVPPRTSTSYRNTIPGYTGKARFDRPQTSAVSLPYVPFTAQTVGNTALLLPYICYSISAACGYSWRCANSISERRLVDLQHPNMTWIPKDYKHFVSRSSPGTLNSPVYGHKAPFSRMVTTVPPGNPYIHPQDPKLSIKYL